MCLRWTITVPFGGPDRDGMSIRADRPRIRHTRGRRSGMSSAARAQSLSHRTNDRPAPVLGPFHASSTRSWPTTRHAPPKQRHTAMQVFRRLRDEHGYPGGYAQVQRYLRKHRRRHRETFIPLGHLPGQRLEADFGHIHVDFPDGRRLVPFLVTTWAYSNAPFVLALPFERTEAILAGMVAAFEFFGCVPKEVWWDNPKTVATLDPPGTPASAPSPLRGAGQPLRLRSPVLHARSGQREARCRVDRQGRATPVRHPRAPSRRSRRAQCVLRKRCQAERARTAQLSAPARPAAAPWTRRIF